MRRLEQGLPGVAKLCRSPPLEQHHAHRRAAPHRRRRHPGDGHRAGAAGPRGLCGAGLCCGLRAGDGGAHERCGEGRGQEEERQGRACDEPTPQSSSASQPLLLSLPTSAAQGSDGAYTASIPASAATPGALVRWFVRAADASGQASRDPPARDATDRQYWGTIVADSGDYSSLPVLEL